MPLWLWRAAWARDRETPTAFVGATVIDRTGRVPVPDAVLLIEGVRIVALGARGEVEIPEDAARLDVGGRWIVPGLIDAHVHFFQSGGLYTRPDVIDLRKVRPYQAELAALRDKLPETLARYLASGITSVVDVGRTAASPWPGRCSVPVRRPSCKRTSRRSSRSQRLITRARRCAASWPSASS